MAGDETDLVFESYEEADSFVRQYEVESGYRHIRKKSRTTTANDVSSLEGHRLICKDWSQKGPTNRTDCVFISLYNEVRECMHGTKRKKKLTDVTTKHKRVLLLKRLKEEFSAETLRRLKILVQIQPDHSDHIVGEAAEFIQPLDSTLVQYIKGKVTDGVKNVDNMLSLINEKNSSSNIRSSNRRFYPTRKTVYNIMYNEINSVRHTKNDQVNTALFIEERKKDLTDALFFRPASDPDSDTEEAKSLLFVYQSSFQQEIVRKYASEVALLDATYNTCKFELPLYMLAIQTNCGFVVIASFIVGKDSKDQVEEALDMIKSWNPSWKPKSFLTDYDRREIGAIEKVFAGSKVYLCQFHVQQAWKRWVSANKELSIEDKNYLLKTLREIRESSTHAICEERMKTLRESRVFNSNQKLRGWLETRWLPENERWVDYFRGSMTIRNDTTNGLEVQHRVLKENYLKKHGFGGTLLSVIQVLLEKYFPAMEIRYKESNIKSLDVSKAYNDQVPEFLRNRPKLFVDHCIRRMPPKVGALASEDFNADNSV